MSQSGHSLLDDVDSWSTEQCREGLTNAVPKLICQLGNGASTDQKISILRILIDHFLPHIGVDVLECQLLSTVLPQMQVLFDKVISDVTSLLSTKPSHASELEDSLLQCLQLLLSMIDILLSCVHQVTSQCKDYGEISLDQIKSLPCTALYIVKGSFSHCKDSNELYGDHFSAVSAPLSALFKKAYGLQKSLMSLLDAVHMSAQDGDEVISKMVQICNGFHEMCCIISSMDSTLMVSTWRFLVKLASKHKDLLRDVLEISSLINSLCSDIEFNYEHCLQVAPLQLGVASAQRDEKAFMKTLKICNLCFKMLMHLLKEFNGYIGHCHKELYHLVIVLQSLVPPSVHAPSISSSAQEELSKSLLVGIEPLLQQLLGNQSFCEVVLLSNQDLTKSQWFSRLLTLLLLLKLIPNASPDTQASLLAPSVFPEDEPRESIVQAVFTAISKCYVELNVPIHLPSIMCNGQAQRDISLQEYVTTHLCGYLATVPVQHYGLVEKILLTSVLDGNINVALTAMDAWCFLARYGTSELCYTQVKLIATLLNSLPANSNPGYIHLCMLLRRLIPLMTAENQVELITLYPVKDNLSLWCSLPVLVFPESTREDLCERIANAAVERCQTWLCAETNALQSLGDVMSHLSAVCNMYRHYEPSLPPITGQVQTDVIKMVCKLWTQLRLDKIASHELLYTVVSLTGLMVQGLNTEHLVNILAELQKLMQCGNATIQLKIVTIDLLRQLGRKKIPPCDQQSQVLQYISTLFSMVLADKHWVVHQMALQAFSIFAEETCHESVVPECLHNEMVQRMAIQFLSKEPRSVSPEASEIELLEEQLQQLCSFAKQQQQVLTKHANQPSVPSSITTSEEPAKKRAKYDDIELHDTINQVKSGLQRIKELKDGNLEQYNPPWFIDELRLMRNQLVSLIQSDVAI